MRATTLLHRVTLWICGSAAGVCLAQNMLPNPTFDEGQDQPQGWSLVGPSGSRLLKAYGNRSVLMVEGNGKSQTFWRTEPISLKPDSLYRLSFLGRWERANAEGAAIAGLGTINRDFLPTGSWTRYSYVFSCPETKDSKDYVRLGEWHVSGSGFVRWDSYSKELTWRFALVPWHDRRTKIASTGNSSPGSSLYAARC